MEKIFTLLFLLSAFCMNVDAQYYTRQSGDTVFVVKQKKEPEPLRWTRYVYIDRKDRPFRVYQDGDKLKFYYSKKYCIQSVPRRVKKQIIEDMARRGELAVTKRKK